MQFKHQKEFAALTSIAANDAWKIAKLKRKQFDRVAVDDNGNVVTMKTREPAIISHVDNRNRFYMQLNSNRAALEQFQESLQIVAPQSPAPIVMLHFTSCKFK